MSKRFGEKTLKHWAQYWKNLYADYKNVTIDIAKECKERPVKASIYLSIIGGSIYCAKQNPDKVSFRDKLIQSNLQLAQVSDLIRNKNSEHRIRWLEQCTNQETIRYMNLGLFSLIWLDNYADTCALYKATCPYQKPRYLTFYKRIVDIGFLNRWWILERTMVDYDVNVD